MNVTFTAQKSIYYGENRLVNKLLLLCKTFQNFNIIVEQINYPYIIMHYARHVIFCCLLTYNKIGSSYHVMLVNHSSG